jgi:alanyl-tRNA synthetase
MRHHTATHLLQSALRAVLGTHVLQHGSLVAPDRLRFDFSHLAALTQDEIAAVESWVNRAIRENLPVEPRFLPYAEALQAGAIALFGEKYSAEVRMVDVVREDGDHHIGTTGAETAPLQPSNAGHSFEATTAVTGDDPSHVHDHAHVVSRELCGGTHVHGTGDIGVFVILSEASIGAGMRRIEALAGRPAEAWLRQQRALLEQVARAAQASPADLPQRVASLQEEAASLRRRLEAIESARSRDQASTLLERARDDVDGIRYLAEVVEAPNIEALRTMGDEAKQRLGSGIVVIASLIGGQPSFLGMVTPDLVANGYHAGNLIRSVAQEAGGSGGGRPELGQGGGRDASRMATALQAVPRVLRSMQSASQGASQRSVRASTRSSE